METTIKYKKAYLADCQVIDAPGKYALKVSNDVTDKNLVASEDGTNPRYIVGFKAIAADKLPQVAEVFKNDEEVDIEQTNGLFMTANLWQTGNEQIPVKGETVDAIVDLVPAREGEDLVLRITSFKVRKAQVAKKLDLNKLFAPTETEAATSGNNLQHS